MPVRNGDHGYGAVTKSLHWATVLAITTQFAVGYTMETEDSGHGRGRGHGEGSGHGRGGDDDDLSLFFVALRRTSAWCSASDSCPGCSRPALEPSVTVERL